MHAAGPGFLGETANRFFDIVRGDHHEVCQFVDNNDNKGHRFVWMKFIIPRNVPRLRQGKAFVPVIHFPDSPAQDAGRFFRAVTTGVSK